VETFDKERQLVGELDRRLPVRINTRPLGAEVLLFRFAVAAELEGGSDRRRVFVPASGPLPLVLPGARGLRVVRASGGLDLQARGAVGKCLSSTVVSSARRLD
jgi:hypothetical protein